MSKLISIFKVFGIVVIPILTTVILLVACGQPTSIQKPLNEATSDTALLMKTDTPPTALSGSSQPLFVVLSENQTALLAAYEGNTRLQVLYQLPDGIGRAQVTFYPPGSPVISHDNIWVTVVENKAKGSSDIVKIDLATQEATKLLDWAGPQFNATISPDSKHIAFLSAEGECKDRQGYADRYWCPNKHVYVMDSNGDHVVRLTEKAADRCFLQWSPTGAQLTYQESCDPPSYSDNPPHIYMITLGFDNRPSRTTRLTSSGSNSLWSPDGKWLRWLALDNVYHLSQLDNAGNIITDTILGLEGGGVWMPDSQHLGGVTSKGDIEICGFGMNCPTITAHLPNITPYVPQQWLADGKRLVFPADKIDAQGKLLPGDYWYVVNIDGTNLIEYMAP